MAKNPPVLDRRRAGVLLHPTSLPGGVGNGELGPHAYRLIDFLQAAGFSVWQTLPLGPTHADRSPYQCLSVHAGNPLLISLDLLVEHGWLERDGGPAGEGSDAYRARRLGEALSGFETRATAVERGEFTAFVQEHAHWLADYALYLAIKGEKRNAPWWEWPAPLRDREPAALAAARARLDGAMELVRFEQFLFFRQWRALKHYANERGVKLFGDLPIFVAHDSAEVWAHPEYFAIDEQGRTEVVAGVPPDYFSATGQRWGNPLYCWEVMANDGFAWWRSRLQTQIELFDLVRIDHFRGFESYWEIPAFEETAINGRWVPAPGASLFKLLRKEFHPLPLVAEDLGVITPEVEALRDHFGLPGMKILQFAFDGSPANPYLPHNQRKNCVVYTGTHDNDTTLGWFESLDDGGRHRVLEYLGFPREAMPWPLVRAALASPACYAIVPMQDLLALDGHHRMNTPGTPDGNWQWGFEWEQLPESLAGRLRHMVWIYGRQA